MRADPLPQDRDHGRRRAEADRKEVPVEAIGAPPFPGPGVVGSGSRVRPRGAERPLAAPRCAAKDGGTTGRQGHTLAPQPSGRGGGGAGVPGRGPLGVRHTHILTAAAATRKHQPGTETRRGTGRGEDK